MTGAGLRGGGRHNRRRLEDSGDLALPLSAQFHTPLLLPLPPTHHPPCGASLVLLAAGSALHQWDATHSAAVDAVKTWLKSDGGLEPDKQINEIHGLSMISLVIS